jgi:carbon monoxide dehydrogenase subunit G
MELTSTRTIAAPLPKVWAALNDPATLKACLPGCEKIEADGVNAYRVVMAAKVGPVSARFSGRMELADVEPMRGYTLRFDGQGGAAGFAKGEASVSLADADAGAATALSYRAKAQVGGKIAQIGSRLVDNAAAKLADDFFARFAEAVAPPPEIAAPAPAPQPVVPAGFGVAHWVRWAAIVAIVALLLLGTNIAGPRFHQRFSAWKALISKFFAAAPTGSTPDAACCS